MTPDATAASTRFAEDLTTHLSAKLAVLDASLTAAAYAATPPASPFNLSQTDAKGMGARVGCDFFIVLRYQIQRRSASGRNEYYEAHAPVYVFSSRTGRLVFWRLQRFDAATSGLAAKQMEASLKTFAYEIDNAIRRATRDDLTEPLLPSIEEVPAHDSPLAKNFKAPIPFRRIKPEYTAEAAAYDIAATVDIVVDIADDGRVLRTEIQRAAGFGLDESVEKAVRAMAWRAAERGGRFIPMRVLLRYNFKKLDKE